MKLNKILGLSLAIAGLMTVSARATEIVGDIGFTGTFTQNGGTAGDLTTATSFNITTVSILTDNGDLDGSTGPIFLTPIANNAALLLGETLWTVTTGPKTFNLVITSATKITNTAATVAFQGYGNLDDGVGGLDQTNGFWQLSLGVSGNSLTWQSTSNSVPDGAATVILLGTAMAGMALFRRRVLS